MKKGHIKRLLVIVLLSYFIMMSLIRWTGDLTKYKKNFIDDMITVTVITKEGEVNHYETNKIDKTSRGDTVIADIKLPKEKYIKDASICLKVYNSVTRLYFEDQLLYHYGEELDEKGRLIGAVFIRQEIPEEAWGKSLRLECDVKEEYAISDISNVMVIDTLNSLKYYLVNNEIEFFVLVTTLFVTVMTFLTGVFYGNWNSSKRNWVHLCNSCLVLTVWLLSFSGMYHLFLDNERLFANLEYFSLFLVPLHFMLYLYEEQKEKKYRICYGGMIVVYAIVILIVTILNYTTRDYHYARTVPIMNVFAAITAAQLVYQYIRERRNNSLKTELLKYGVLFTVGVFGFEVIRYNIVKYIFNTVWNSSNVAVISLLIMVVVVAISYVLQMTESMLGENEKRYLEEMAFIDGLTGVANRTGCYEYFESIGIRNCKQYAVVYWDLNNLKPLNDNYGHNMGDELICFLSSTIQECFQLHSFCGRLGGDEFISVIEGSETIHVPEYINQVVKTFAESNAQKRFPIPISVAYGMAKSTVACPLDINEALRIADKNMYETKKRYKEKR